MDEKVKMPKGKIYKMGRVWCLEWGMIGFWQRGTFEEILICLRACLGIERPRFIRKFDPLESKKANVGPRWDVNLPMWRSV
jgi:hypothetical protein